jgi:Flp pilus assembly protein TadB
MLSSLIKAGLTLDEAIAYISVNYNSEASKLFRMLHTKILEGHSKPEAFNIIARLSFCSEFKNLIKVLAQSEIIGNPVKDILKDLSRVMRENQRDFLKMKAEKLESNLIIVIFIFIFIPVIALFLIPVIPQLQILF